MNRVELIGRITRELETRYTPSQMAVLNFSIAIDRGTDREGNDKGADFPRITVFGKQAESMPKYVGKGCRVAVEGRIQTGSYTDKYGNKVYTTDVVADRVEYIDFLDDEDEEFVEDLEATSPDEDDMFSMLDEDLPWED